MLNDECVLHRMRPGFHRYVFSRHWNWLVKTGKSQMEQITLTMTQFGVPESCTTVHAAAVLLVLWYFSAALSFLFLSPVFRLHLSDSRQAYPRRSWRWRGQVWSQQSRVHGESAAEQWSVSARRLWGGCTFVHRRLERWPTELHPLQ